MAFGQVCQANLMFFMAQSIYVNVSWGQDLFYKAAKAFIDPETQKKIVLDKGNAPTALTKLFHPCQLEKRFGGEAETPSNFWPPRVGEVFNDDHDKESILNMIEKGTYEKMVDDNPLLFRHPDYIQSKYHNSRDFKFDEKEETTTSAVTSPLEVDNGVSADDIEVIDGSELLGPSQMAASSASKASVYFDAYTGDANYDDITESQNRDV